MTRVVILAPPGLAARHAPVAWRLAQLARLYCGIGRAVDLVICGDASEADLLAAWRLFDGVALAGPEGPEAGFFRRFTEPAGCAVVHALIPPPEGAPGLRIRDITLGRDAVEEEADLVIAASDLALGPYLRLGRGLRLPWLPPPPAGPRLPRPETGPIGWVGGGGASLAGAWSALLAALWQRQGGWPGGVLLAGPWAAAVEVPLPMTGVRRIAAPEDPATVFRALGLAVLPAAAEAGEELALFAALRLGLPVLAAEPAAAHFADRWPLPRPGSPEEMADLLVAGGIAGAAPPEALSRAAAEMDRDGAAMEAHVAARLAARLA